MLKYAYDLYFLKSLKDETPLVFSILGSHKDFGFAYPSAVVNREQRLLKIAYSVNKEDIEMMTVRLDDLAV